jgi:capsule polysaccharide modification protein KpsS
MKMANLYDSGPAGEFCQALVADDALITSACWGRGDFRHGDSTFGGICGSV